jgi:hypothetical protein
MKVKTQEVIPHNFVVDAVGFGVKAFDYSSEDLNHMIKTDITSNYDCITYFNSKVDIEDNHYEVQVDIRLYFKTYDCEDSDAMLTIITQYLKDTFLC